MPHRQRHGAAQPHPTETVLSFFLHPARVSYTLLEVRRVGLIDQRLQMGGALLTGDATDAFALQLLSSA